MSIGSLSNGRVLRMQRLLALRCMREQLDRAAVVTANRAVREVADAAQAQRSAAVAATATGYRALVDGDHGEWLFADAQREVAGWNSVRLARLKSQREGEVQRVMDRWRTSRMKQEQMRLLVESAQGDLRRATEVSAQAEADNLFLSRRMAILNRS